MSDYTETELIARQALRCLFLAVDESVAKDVERKVGNALDERRRLFHAVQAEKDVMDTARQRDQERISALESENAKLADEMNALREEYRRATEVSEDDAWTLDVPSDDKACVAEYRIRWLRVKMQVAKLADELKAERDGLTKRLRVAISRCICEGLPWCEACRADLAVLNVGNAVEKTEACEGCENEWPLTRRTLAGRLAWWHETLRGAPLRSMVCRNRAALASEPKKESPE